MITPEELLGELLRFKAIELKATCGNQNDAILEMSKVGFPPSRIATLLGTTPGTVNTAIQRAKKASTTKKLDLKEIK
jgi:hypothetical protein